MTRCLFGSLHHTLNPRVHDDQVWQATTLLMQAGVDVGVTDLIALV